MTSGRRAGLEEARFVMLQESHIDLVLFVGYLISLCEHAIITAAGRWLRRRQASNAAGAHVQCNFMSCPPRLSQDLFFVEQSDEFAGSFYGFHRFCFCCPFHGLLLHCCTRQCVLQCLTGVHGAFDCRHHRCASGTRSSTRCCSRAVAVIRLQIQEQIVDVPVPQIKEEIVEIVAGEVVCNARTGVRRQHGWTCTFFELIVDVVHGSTSRSLT